MKVFISWSGETSKSIAEVLRDWLPSVIQAVKPYFSPDDIIKGARWSMEISKELEKCKVGLICLTADNLEAPWIMFEAGALSKSVSSGRVCPLLFGVDASDVKGPLVQFQAAPFAKDEMKKAIQMMNQELGDDALSSEVLDSVFEMWWPQLEEKITKALSVDHGLQKQPLRSERDILEEILARVRTAEFVSSRGLVHSDSFMDLFECDDWMREISNDPLEACRHRYRSDPILLCNSTHEKTSAKRKQHLLYLLWHMANADSLVIDQQGPLARISTEAVGDKWIGTYMAPDGRVAVVTEEMLTKDKAFRAAKRWVDKGQDEGRLSPNQPQTKEKRYSWEPDDKYPGKYKVILNGIIIREPDIGG